MERILRSGLGDRRLSGSESWGLRSGSPRQGGSQAKIQAKIPGLKRKAE